VTLDSLITERRIVICAGSGGVGKTTTAAVLAMEAARRGRRSVVVTIDPAKRLADALGLSGIGNEPRRIDGDWPGEMSAVMLDTKGTFDALVETYSESPEQATRILDNRFYRNISGALSGTQEYMAMEKLYALHHDESFDVVVVDTPPTRHALDFLDAPRRLTHFLDHRLYRVLMSPTRGVMKAVHVAAQTFVRSVSKVVGTEVLDDALAFFGAFSGMEEGFKDRARVVLELLEDPATAFVLVAAPRRDTVAEAQYFADRLADARLAVAALIVNRVHPLFTVDTPEKVAARADDLADTPLGPLTRNLAEFTAIATNERAHLAGLTATAEQVVMVPYLNSDVHDLDGLNRIGEHLFAAEAN
jgi:anion-transporting  ArsA/GET3 family ATPase